MDINVTNNYSPLIDDVEDLIEEDNSDKYEINTMKSYKQLKSNNDKIREETLKF